MKILLLEDDKGSRVALERFLKKINHDIITFENPIAALDYLSKEKCDIIISDVKMPNMSGLEFLEELNGRNLITNTEVIFVTGFATIKEAVKALKLGAFDYISKPIEIDELVSAISKIEDIKRLKSQLDSIKHDFQLELEKTKETFFSQISELKKKILENSGLSHLAIYSDTMKSVYAMAEMIGQDRTVPILLEGETGTGKEMLARYIHLANEEPNAPFVAINCPAINPNLFESELFGYESGAFTGALAKGQKGKFELAAGGTILLDEISEIPNEIQAKLLRIIQERKYFKVGGIKEYDLNARIICTTNRNIKALVQEGKFREDLYYRLTTGHIVIPPLRERKSEIIPLATSFLLEFSERRNKRFKRISNEAQTIFLNHSWDGNIRELRNIIEKIVVLFNDIELKPIHLQVLPEFRQRKTNINYLEIPIAEYIRGGNELDIEKYILEIVNLALEYNNNNKLKTANMLKISRDKLYTYVKRLDANELEAEKEKF
ncbi:MAG TPA: sigma-54 dependent transcriptional regulator [Ignavibacteriales bacterium]|nr:sigma-54 dependent transcriptional regulator [Ignavibacteriales bacterium]HOL80286.1 sigma-54 dependent transcriptional regulator [Ignavibacteriales bacterium]HOM64565.1 sigma-54 dependent transcriptional regulator [Ignavibacteriales bacterium]HPD66662.1 sigma-54 dependent transcriptional regulator [Ignavibacteriales bacterium]HPP32475.1 sigma-54 dependent transcriptional regulator [Ignavibacteriales bacterium]